MPQGIVPLSEARAKSQGHVRLSTVDGVIEVRVHGPGGLLDYRWRSSVEVDGSRRVERLDAEGTLEESALISEEGTRMERQDARGRRLDPACVAYALTLDAAGRVSAEACIGETGAELADRQGVARWKHTLDALGRREESRAFLNGGRPIKPLNQPYAGLQRVWDEHGQLIARVRLSESGRPVSPEDAGFTAEAWDYDGEGRLVERRFEDARGRKVHGPEGWAVETRRYTPSAEGVQVVVTTHNRVGQPTRRASGAVARLEELRDAEGRLLARSAFDVSGSPTVMGEGRVHRAVHTYDQAGRPLTSAWFGVGGRPARHAHRGVHKETYTYDDAGREVALAYHDGLGRLSVGPEGWARRTMRYNHAGQRDLIAFEGSDGQPVGRTADGVARLFDYYDRSGQLSQRARSGASGRPIAGKGGAARDVWEFDAEGRVVAESWFDVIEAPMTHRGRGCAKETIAYDVHGEESERRCLDPEGEPTLSSVLGAAGRLWQRDGRGMVTRETWLDTEARPMMTRHGYAVRVTRYDARGELLTRSVLDAESRPTFGADGWSERRFTRDPQGRVLSVRTVDTLGNLVGDKSGVAQVQTTYNGALTRERFLGTDGQPVGGAGGVAGQDLQRDPYGRVVKETKVDVSALAIRDPLTGCATLETDYSVWGDVTRERCLDPQGQLVLGVEGWAMRTREFNPLGLEVVRRLFDASEAPIQGREGWSTEQRQYDDRGWLKTRRFLDVAGEPTGPSLHLDRDAQGRIVRERWLDPAGAPAMSSEGWAMKRLDYDALGRLVSEGYAGTEARKTSRQIVRKRYGARGRLVERRWLNAKGVVSPGPEGYAIERMTHDDRGRLVAKRFFDAQDAPGFSGQPRVAERYVRDAMGRLIERRAMASKELLVDGFQEGKTRWAIERQRYDPLGRRTSRAIFDVGERPVVGSDGMHLVTWRWNARDQLVSQERFVAPKRPAPGGWARQEHTYDRFGRLTAIAYQNAMGQAATVWGGVGMVQLAYGRDGRLATMSWHAPGGAGINAKVCYPGSFCAKRPVHQARYRYEGDGPAVEMTLHDLKGTRRKTLDCAKGQCF